MGRPLSFVALSLRRCLFGALTLVAACAHGADPAEVDDSGDRSGSSGRGGGAGSAGSGNGGRAGASGSVAMAGGGGGGSDTTADSSAPADDASSEAGPDATDVRDGDIDSALIDAGSPTRPTAVTLSATSVATARQTPSAGGAPYNDECPQNQVLIGFKGTVDAKVADAGTPTNLRSVQGICAPLAISATMPYSVTVGTSTLLPVRQTASAVAQSVTCPGNHVIVGFDGRAAQYIESLSFRCAPLNISGTSPAFTLTLGGMMTRGPIGAASAGTAFPSINCPANQVAIAQAPRAGAAIDSFGLVCRTPTLVIQ